MNSVTKSTLWMLLVYGLLAFTMAWWMGSGLRTAAHDVMDDTARHIGREVSGALHQVSFKNLIQGGHDARTQLRKAVESTTRASSVLSALSIVGSEGTIVASDDRATIGQQLALPREVFALDREAKLFSTFSGPFDTGTHLLLTPVFEADKLVGYIQMNLNNRVIGRLYEATYWRLLVLGLMGFVAIIVIGVILHFRLSRYQCRLSSLFDSALAGNPMDEMDEFQAGNEFGRIQSAAKRLGSELQAARGRAKLSRQELDTVATVLKVGMLVIGSNRELQFSNRAAQEMLTGGWPDKFSAQLAILCEHLQQAEVSIQDSDRSHINIDLELMIGEEPRRFLMEVYAMEQDEWQRFLIIIKDREMIDALETDLRTATRFRGLSTLYVGAAHDLRGPLNNMVVHLELLKQGIKVVAAGSASQPDVVRQRNHIEIIQQEIYRLNHYVQALLDLTAPSQDGDKASDIGQLLTEIAGLVKAQAKLQRVSLDWRIPDSPVVVMCQQMHLRQVLLNIIINALEAMPSGGTLTVSLRQELNFVIVEICDTGAGIPEALQQHIFEMHFTTKNTGTGIGLYVANSIVEQLSGTISVQSKPGEGSCFAVRLPLAVAMLDESTTAADGDSEAHPESILH